MLIFKLLAIGLFVGIASSMFGIGGGILISPLLPIVTAISQREAVATSLLCILVVVGVNTYSYWKKGLVNKRLALIFGGLASVGAMSASLYSKFVPDQWIRLVTGILLIWIAVKMVYSRKSKEVVSQTDNEKTNEVATSFQKPPHYLNYILGFIAGSASGFSGVGTGALLSPLFLHNKWVPSNQVAPTLNAILAMTSFFGALAYIAQGENLVRYDLSLGIILSALFASYAGRKFNDSLSDLWRRRIMSGLLFGLALLVLVPVIWSYV
jgi:uncharacterized membrane protein YfcA